MESSRNRIEQLVEKAEKTPNDTERQQLNHDASNLHQLATGGHPMKFDAEGKLDKNDPEAKKCPFIK
ncbi:hypothetical protein BJ944DRAFT_240272 [Cunninghamella echinulata]|nr:hypothetical protein BJ944DRAFT_240272 [Cunninghamella echinulata]